MIGSIIVLFVLMVYSFIVLDDRISYAQGQSDGGRRNLHQRISTLETSLGEIERLRKDLDEATERLELVAEVLRPTTED